ncbi:MAG: hypothetical protein ABI693_35235, partial [Bryobacteraceae bacterium]
SPKLDFGWRRSGTCCAIKGGDKKSAVGLLMREFFRDTIANLNGMYYVMTVNPQLLRDAPL